MRTAARTRLVVSVWHGLLTIAILAITPGVPQAVDAAKANAAPARDPIVVPTPVEAKDVGCEELVFVRRKPYSSEHYYTNINNGTSGDRFLPEGCNSLMLQVVILMFP